MGIVCAFFGLPLEPQRVFDSCKNTIKHLHFGIQKLKWKNIYYPNTLVPTNNCVSLTIKLQTDL